MRQAKIFSGRAINAESSTNEFLKKLDEFGRSSTAKIQLSGSGSDTVVLVEYDHFDNESPNEIV